MGTTKLSSKGQVIIPKAVRAAHNWKTGQQLEVIDTGDGVLLRPGSVFKPTRLGDVAGFLTYDGPPKSLEEMDEAIRKGALRQEDGDEHGRG